MGIAYSGLAVEAQLVGFGLGGAEWDAMALDASATAFNPSQTALVSEITTNGGARKSGVDVTCTLQTTNFADDTRQWVSEWAFTGISGSLAVNGFGVFNDPSAGDMLLRQVFSQGTYYAVTDDSLELTVKVISTGPDNDVVVGVDNPGVVLTRAGIVEMNKLTATDQTPANGRFSHIELGTDDGTALTLADTNTVLGAPIVDTGLARVSATVSRVQTNVPNDTTRWLASWTASGAKAIREAGLFNKSAGGDMAIRHIMARPWNVGNTDIVEFDFKLVETA